MSARQKGSYDKDELSHRMLIVVFLMGCMWNRLEQQQCQRKENDRLYLCWMYVTTNDLLSDTVTCLKGWSEAFLGRREVWALNEGDLWLCLYVCGECASPSDEILADHWSHHCLEYSFLFRILIFMLTVCQFVFKCMFTCLSFEQTVKWQGAVQRSETLGLFSSTCSAQQCDLCSSLPVRRKEASKERPSLEVFQFGLEWRPLQSPQANSQVWGGFRPLLPRVHCSQAFLPPPLCLFWLFHLFPPVLLLARLWWQMTLWE